MQLITFKRGLSAAAAALTFALGEPAWLTDIKKLIIGDGVTPGGNGVVMDDELYDANGKIKSALIPDLAITDTFPVADEAAMLALVCQKGDVAIRTDESKSYILAGLDPSVLANWKFLGKPTDVVLTVNGRTGVVTLTKEDVGLGNVPNVAPSVLLNNTVLTGAPTATTPAANDSSTAIATTEFVRGAPIDGGVFV